MPFKSDKQRKGFFGNRGNSSAQFPTSVNNSYNSSRTENMNKRGVTVLPNKSSSIELKKAKSSLRKARTNQAIFKTIRLFSAGFTFEKDQKMFKNAVSRAKAKVKLLKDKKFVKKQARLKKENGLPNKYPSGKPIPKRLKIKFRRELKKVKSEKKV